MSALIRSLGLFASSLLLSTCGSPTMPGEGANDRGAIVYYPKVDRALHTGGLYSTTIVDDRTGWRLDQAFEHAPVNRRIGVMGWRLSDRNWKTIYRFTTTSSKGYRPGFGGTDALTIVLVHPDSFFPDEDAVYQRDLSFERVAEMLNVHRHAAPGGDKHRGHLVIIDNRETFRGANVERAKLRNHETFQPANHATNPALYPEAVVIFPEAGLGLKFDAATKMVTDSRDGSRFTGRQLGSRDEIYFGGEWYDAPTGRTAEVTFRKQRGFKPGHGETVMLEVIGVGDHKMVNGRVVSEKISRDEMPPERLATLLNYFEPAIYRGEHTGNIVVIDTRTYGGPRPQGLARDP